MHIDWSSYHSILKFKPPHIYLFLFRCCFTSHFIRISFGFFSSPLFSSICVSHCHVILFLSRSIVSPQSENWREIHRGKKKPNQAKTYWITFTYATNNIYNTLQLFTDYKLRRITILFFVVHCSIELWWFFSFLCECVFTFTYFCFSVPSPLSLSFSLLFLVLGEIRENLQHIVISWFWSKSHRIVSLSSTAK